MPPTEFERLREVFGELAVRHARQFALERLPADARLAQRYFAAARDLPVQLAQRAGNQTTYDVFRELLEDLTTLKEISDAMGWPVTEPATPPRPPADARHSVGSAR